MIVDINGKQSKKRRLKFFPWIQTIDIRDVSFHPFSSSKVVCTGAKPSAA